MKYLHRPDPFGKMITLTINGKRYEGVEEIVNALMTESGEFEVRGEPKNLERLWEEVLWKVKKNAYVFSYVVSADTIKGEVRRPSEVSKGSRERRTPSQRSRRKRPSRSARPSGRGRSRGKK